MPILEALSWIAIGLFLGGVANFLPHQRGRGFWLVLGSALFAFVGGTLGKFVLAAPTGVEAGLSWLSPVLAAAAVAVFVFYELVIGHPRTGAPTPHA
jgi:hypothetical protein